MSTMTSSDDSGVVTPQLSRLTLYLKALSLFESSISAVNQYKQQQQYATQKTSHFPSRPGALVLPKLDSLLEWLVEQFQLYFKRSERLKKHVQDALGMASSIDDDAEGTGSGDDLDDELEPTAKGKRRRGGKIFTPELSFPSVHIPSAEKLIYEWAMKLAKDAAISEMMNNTNYALSNYRSSLRLFEQLAAEQVDQHDSVILQTVASEIQARVDALQQSDQS